MRTLRLFSVLVFMSVASMASAGTLQSVFDDANEAFGDGEYEKAVERYEKLAKLGVNDPDVLFNLATAYARLGKLGHAVWNYEKVLRLNPGASDAAENLAEIREFLARHASEMGRDADLAPATGPWRAVIDRFTLSGAAMAFLVFYLSFFGALLARRRFESGELPRLFISVLAGVLFLLFAAFGGVAVGKWHHSATVREAVVLVSDVVPVMEGPQSTVQRFFVEEGTKIKVIGVIDNWTRLADDQGRDGWILSESLGEL